MIYILTIYSTCLKVLIQETEEQRSLGVGVVWSNFGNHAMPGKKDGTVGYLVDEGKIFGPFESVKEYEGIKEIFIIIDFSELSVTRHSTMMKNKMVNQWI